MSTLLCPYGNTICVFVFCKCQKTVTKIGSQKYDCIFYLLSVTLFSTPYKIGCGGAAESKKNCHISSRFCDSILGRLTSFAYAIWSQIYYLTVEPFLNNYVGFMNLKSKLCAKLRFFSPHYAMIRPQSLVDSVSNLFIRADIFIVLHILRILGSLA